MIDATEDAMPQVRYFGYLGIGGSLAARRDTRAHYGSLGTGQGMPGGRILVLATATARRSGLACGVRCISRRRRQDQAGDPAGSGDARGSCRTTLPSRPQRLGGPAERSDARSVRRRPRVRLQGSVALVGLETRRCASASTRLGPPPFRNRRPTRTWRMPCATRRHRC